MNKTQDNDNHPPFLLHCAAILFPFPCPALPHHHHHHFSPSNNDHGLFIDWLFLPVCGTKRLKLDLQIIAEDLR